MLLVAQLADLLFITLCVPFTAADYASTSVWTFGIWHHWHQRCFTSTVTISLTWVALLSSPLPYFFYCHLHSQSSTITTIIFKSTKTTINLTTKMMKMVTIRRVLVSPCPISDCGHSPCLHLHTRSYVSCKVIPSSSKSEIRAIKEHRRFAYLRIAAWKAIPRLAI